MARRHRGGGGAVGHGAGRGHRADEHGGDQCCDGDSGLVGHGVVVDERLRVAGLAAPAGGVLAAPADALERGSGSSAVSHLAATAWLSESGDPPGSHPADASQVSQVAPAVDGGGGG